MKWTKYEQREMKKEDVMKKVADKKNKKKEKFEIEEWKCEKWGGEMKEEERGGVIERRRSKYYDSGL